MARIDKNSYLFDLVRGGQEIREGDIFAYPIAFIEVSYTNDYQLMLRDTYEKGKDEIVLPNYPEYVDRNISIVHRRDSGIALIFDGENRKMSEQLCLIEFKKDDKTGKIYPFEVFTQQRLGVGYESDCHSLEGKSNEQIQSEIEKPYIEVEKLILPSPEVGEYFRSVSSDKNAIRKAINDVIASRKENAYECVLKIAKERPNYINPTAESFFDRIVNPDVYSDDNRKSELMTMMEEDKKEENFLSSLVEELKNNNR